MNQYLELLKLLPIPIIALFGGAGTEAHFKDAFLRARLMHVAAGVFHFGEIMIPEKENIYRKVYSVKGGKFMEKKTVLISKNGGLVSARYSRRCYSKKYLW